MPQFWRSLLKDVYTCMPQYLRSLLKDMYLYTPVLEVTAEGCLYLYAPVLEVTAEGHHAHLVHHMKTTGPVEVQDRLEGPACAVDWYLYRSYSKQYSYYTVKGFVFISRKVKLRIIA